MRIFRFINACCLVFGVSFLSITFSQTYDVNINNKFDSNDERGEKLVWSEEFDGEVLNSEHWTVTIGDGCPQLCGFGNNELEYYTDSNISVANGLLIITAKEETKGNREYTSGRIISQNKVELKYGRIDVRAKLPDGKGIWPAIWLLGANKNKVSWPACGEIDIMELRGSKPEKVCGTVHYKNKNGVHQFLKPPECYQLDTGNFSDDFHIFSLIWDKKQITWLVDSKPFRKIEFNDLNTKRNDRTFKKEFYLILNLAVGGHYDGNPDSTTSFPKKMLVDYVRVYK